VRTASFRTSRGYTILAAILDELAFWHSEESANPASEVITAIIPGLATIPSSLLLAISTPYARSGPLYEVFREAYRAEDNNAPLVWKASTLAMNPTFDERRIKTLWKRDSIAARSEYEAEFREDLETYLSTEQLDAVIIPGRQMLPPDRHHSYFAFVDVSGGRGDSFALAVAHREGEAVVVDRVEEVRAPIAQPSNVVASFSEILKGYGISSVIGDRYGGNWSSGKFRKFGIIYEDSKWDKSEVYIQFQAIMAMRRVELAELSRLRTQLLQLERRTHSGGKDVVDHPEGLHDDVANATAGVVTLAFQERIWDSEEVEAHLPTTIHKGDPFGSDERLKNIEKEMEDWMRETGCSKIMR